jgi:hypothetical protein
VAVAGSVVVLARTGVLPAPPWTPQGTGSKAVAAAPHADTPASDTTVAAAPIIVSPPETVATARIDAAAPPPAVLVAPAPRTETRLPALRAKWTAEWANVRADRTVASPVVRVLAPGQKVEIGDLELGWWALFENGTLLGYVANSVLTETPPPG